MDRASGDRPMMTVSFGGGTRMISEQSDGVGSAIGCCESRGSRNRVDSSTIDMYLGLDLNTEVPDSKGWSGLVACHKQLHGT